jgi:2-oxoglutarate ferredoxin oxidoreductase subunit gamma
VSGFSPGDRYEVRLSGSGGQGLIFAGVVLAEATGLGDGFTVVQTQSYGPEARGGALRADLVISEHEIAYPKPVQLDLLLALTQEAADKYVEQLKPDGFLILDSHGVPNPPREDAFSLPLIEAARDELSRPVVANVVALGAICAITGVVTPESLRAVVLHRAPKGTEKTNEAAVELGMRLGASAVEGL